MNLKNKTRTRRNKKTGRINKTKIRRRNKTKIRRIKTRRNKTRRNKKIGRINKMKGGFISSPAAYPVGGSWNINEPLGNYYKHNNNPVVPLNFMLSTRNY